MAAVVVVAAAATLAWSAMQTSAATSVNFSAGSLIIPMDTDSTGNHASYNQNTGMWKAYGLLYRLLAERHPGPVGDQPDEDRRRATSTSRVTNVKDKRTGRRSARGTTAAARSSSRARTRRRRCRSSRPGGRRNGNQPNVHEAQAALHRRRPRHPASAPADRQRGDQRRASGSPTTTRPGSPTRTGTPGRPHRRTSSTRPRSRTAGCSPRARPACSGSTTSSSRRTTAATATR